MSPSHLNLSTLVLVHTAESRLQKFAHSIISRDYREEAMSANKEFKGLVTKFGDEMLNESLSMVKKAIMSETGNKGTDNHALLTEYLETYTEDEDHRDLTPDYLFADSPEEEANVSEEVKEDQSDEAVTGVGKQESWDFEEKKSETPPIKSTLKISTRPSHGTGIPRGSVRTEHTLAGKGERGRSYTYRPLGTKVVYYIDITHSTDYTSLPTNIVEQVYKAVYKAGLFDAYDWRVSQRRTFMPKDLPQIIRFLITEAYFDGDTPGDISYKFNVTRATIYPNINSRVINEQENFRELYKNKRQDPNISIKGSTEQDVGDLYYVTDSKIVVEAEEAIKEYIDKEPGREEMAEIQEAITEYEDTRVEDAVESFLDLLQSEEEYTGEELDVNVNDGQTTSYEFLLNETNNGDEGIQAMVDDLSQRVGDNRVFVRLQEVYAPVISLVEVTIGEIIEVRLARYGVDDDSIEVSLVFGGDVYRDYDNYSYTELRHLHETVMVVHSLLEEVVAIDQLYEVVSGEELPTHPYTQIQEGRTLTISTIEQ